MCQKMTQKAQNRDIIQFCDKIALNLAKILPKLGNILHKHRSHVHPFLYLYLTEKSTPNIAVQKNQQMKIHTIFKSFKVQIEMTSSNGKVKIAWLCTLPQD